MAKIDSLLKEYGESHQNPTNKLVHWICVPAIVLSLFGLLWSIPLPSLLAEISTGPVAFNWALLFLIVALVSAVLGFGGVAGTAAWIAQVLFVVFLVLFLVSLLTGSIRTPPM